MALYPDKDSQLSKEILPDKPSFLFDQQAKKEPAHRGPVLGDLLVRKVLRLGHALPNPFIPTANWLNRL